MKRFIFTWFIQWFFWIGFIPFLLFFWALWLVIGVSTFLFDLYEEIAERIAEWAYDCKRGGPNTQTGPFFPWLKARIEMGFPGVEFDEQTYREFYDKLYGKND
jgi:hypothetical protein